MFTRKQRERAHHVFALAVSALVLNMILPIHTTVAAAAETSNAVIPQTSQPPIVLDTPAPSLLTVADKPARKVLVVRSSAYSSTKDQTDADPFTTASGSKVHDGIIAANGLPFGTKVRIPAYFGTKVFTVEDRMNARWGERRIDIWTNTRQEAMQWGVRTVQIEIL